MTEVTEQLPAVLTEAARAELPSGAELVWRSGTLTLLTADGEQLSAALRPPEGRPLLLRAALAGREPRPYVADATAGLGGDAFSLAWAGCRVTAFERSAVIALLLHDALRRAALDPQLAAAAARISLQHGDSLRLLSEHGPFDVVFLDPMFPPGRKSSGKRKGMRLLHELGHAVGDEAALLSAARHSALQRVTVKRQLRAGYLAGVAPSGSIRGRTVRFDLYAAYSGQHRTDEGAEQHE